MPFTKMARIVLVLLFLMYTIDECATQEFTSPAFTSPFQSVRGKYQDFNSKVMDLQGQYCGRVCDKKFQFREGNDRCAPCFCDVDCYYYNDCCPDKLLFNKNLSDVTPRKHGCRKIVYSSTPEFSKVIDDCPKFYSNQETTSNCYNNDSLHWKYINPVTDQNTKLTYRNKYCAICNNASDTVRWLTETSCRDDSAYGNLVNTEEIYFSVLNSNVCSLSFKSSTAGFPEKRACSTTTPPVYTKCNETGRWIFYDQDVETACLLYTNVVMGKYGNLFCRLCNERITWQNLEMEPQERVEFGRLSLATLLNLGDEGDSTRTRSRSSVPDKECGVDEVMDPKSCDCREKICSDGEVLENGTCRSIFLKSNNIGYNICIHLKGTFNMRGQNVSPENILVKYRNENFVSFDSDTDTVVDQSFTPVLVIRCGEELVHIEADIYVKLLFESPVNSDDKQIELLKTVHNFGPESSTNGFSMETTLGNICHKPQPEVQTFPVKSNCSLIKPVVLFEAIRIRDEVADILPSIQFLQLNKLMTCVHVSLNSTEVAHNLTDNSLTLLRNNLTLTEGEYKSRDEQFLVCLDDYLNGTSVDYCKPIIGNQTAAWTPLGITSVVCTCISLLFLIITFIFYCVIKSLRNVVGVNVMGLIVTLIFAQVFYEFGLEMTDYHNLCQAMGILIHYFWLSAIFWMNACTLVLFLKLSFPLESRGFTTGQIFRRSCVYSTLSPLIIVGITLGINYGMDGNSGYGGAHSCYIRSVNERRFAFALPLGLLVLINIVLFSYTFIKIRATQMESAINRENKINIVACLKLSVITGASWIFAFVYEATGAIVFAYLFTILVGALGLVLFIAFIVNKRVCQICVEKVRGSDYSQSSSASKQKKYLVKSSGESPLPSLSKARSVSDPESEASIKTRMTKGETEENQF
ncbi:uncharacterized protein LOC126816277 [Patella vulgata]|uniref:uncharacterized protein LOC126816277 n=1 Tax=Patella vulgata TaxID=6465 RepID=UPI00217FDB6E|nr:uncharacterized protein LOC126816277 [Patella vulgata]